MSKEIKPFCVQGTNLTDEEIKKLHEWCSSVTEGDPYESVDLWLGSTLHLGIDDEGDMYSSFHTEGFEDNVLAFQDVPAFLGISQGLSYTVDDDSTGGFPENEIKTFKLVDKQGFINEDEGNRDLLSKFVNGCVKGALNPSGDLDLDNGDWIWGTELDEFFTEVPTNISSHVHTRVSYRDLVKTYIENDFGEKRGWYALACEENGIDTAKTNFQAKYLGVTKHNILYGYEREQTLLKRKYKLLGLPDLLTGAPSGDFSITDGDCTLEGKVPSESVAEALSEGHILCPDVTETLKELKMNLYVGDRGNKGELVYTLETHFDEEFEVKTRAEFDKLVGALRVLSEFR